MATLTVAPCSHEAATYAVLRWHYSQTMPTGKLVKYGVWEDGRFIGCVLFGRGASVPAGVRLQRELGLAITEWCELVRVALDRHEHPTSQIVARALAELRSSQPKLRLVVSFADPEQGHLGTIYQAGNWIYTGSSARTRLFRMGGRWVHERTAHGQKNGNLVKVVRGKHRYLYPLDRRMRRMVEAQAIPFPKLADEGSGVSRRPLQAEGVGATPTVRSE